MPPLPELVLNPDDTIAIGIQPVVTPEPLEITPSYDNLNRACLFYILIHVVLTLYYNVGSIFCIALICIGYTGYRYQLDNFIFVFLLVSMFFDLMLIVCYILQEIDKTSFIIYSFLTTLSIHFIQVDTILY